MYESFEEIRKQHHRRLELQLHSGVVRMAFGNAENIRQGVDRVLGIAGYRAGIPFPPTSGVKVSDSGPVYALALDGDMFFSGAEVVGGGAAAFHRLALILKFLPTKLFGTEEAVRWVELATFRHSDLVDQARAALNDPTGYQRFSKILTHLVEERLPLTDVETILKTIVAAGPLVPVGDEATWKIIEDIRTAIKETSAAYYKDYYFVADVYEAGPELLAKIENSPATVENAITYVAAGLPAIGIIVAEQPEMRRKLWELTEGLYTGGKLDRPLLVLKPSELPATVELPKSHGKISMMVGSAG
jgi:hypothetical protein